MAFPDDNGLELVAGTLNPVSAPVVCCGHNGPARVVPDAEQLIPLRVSKRKSRRY